MMMEFRSVFQSSRSRDMGAITPTRKVGKVFTSGRIDKLQPAHFFLELAFLLHYNVVKRSRRDITHHGAADVYNITSQFVQVPSPLPLAAPDAPFVLL